LAFGVELLVMAAKVPLQEAANFVAIEARRLVSTEEATT